MISYLIIWKENLLSKIIHRLLRKKKEIIYSDNLSNYGITWRLKVYPNGNGQAKGNYLSVFLEMVKGYPSPARYDYKIEMENTINSKNKISREYTSEFEVGEWWGYNRFYRTESIMNEGFVSEENSLKLEFYVRAFSYPQHWLDQSQYIEKLEFKLASAKDKLAQNNLKDSDDDKESEKEDNEEDELDKLPMSESKINNQDQSEDEKEEEKVEPEVNPNSEVIFDSEGNVESSSSKINDSLQENDEEDLHIISGEVFALERRMKEAEDKKIKQIEERKAKHKGEQIKSRYTSYSYNCL